ncbi:hypothetical protein IC229_04230 [Spirosoma sp. BT702]|uniref:Uncharacterized protein n=1 Tax=Spirosoma profusum TaxID=2771354 RepID=A0A926Y0R3_9BACT|nr:DUF5677 domain-containing protein [Spirosoma profusum]MBD2699830.1 hypothetical protein [Spirosoma profusum]
MKSKLIYPDEPIEGLYSSNLIDENTRQSLIKYRRAIYELVCVGTHLLSWEFTINTGSYFEKLAVAAFFRRILQLLDSISILIGEGAADICEIQMRSLVEITLGFEYLLKDDIENRSLIFFLYEYNRKKKSYEKYNAAYNSKYSNLQQAYKSDGFILNDINEIPENTDIIIHYEEKINDPIFDPFRVDFNLKKNNNNLKWYHLGSNIQSLGLLARELGRFELYDIVYQQYNNPVHGTDLMNGVFEHDGVNINLKEIRDPANSKDITRLAIQIGCMAFDHISKRFTKDQQEEVHFRLGRYEVQHTKGIFDKKHI